MPSSHNKARETRVNRYMPMITQPVDRRRFITAAFSLPAALYFTPGLFAEELLKTPAQTEGPFYPDKLPLDSDNDLVIVGNSVTPAVGSITHLSGRILDPSGNPVRSATVEIWQVDNNGAYLHSNTGNRDKRDANFQGYGRFETSSTGEYRFRTIKPVKYPGRTPHIHFKIKAAGQPSLTTQCYVKGDPGNDKDGVLRGIRDDRQRESVMVAFQPLPQSKIGELAARFDIVLGETPSEDRGPGRGMGKRGPRPRA